MSYKPAIMPKHARGPYSPEVARSLENANLLVVGAGGIGCELLKNLAMLDPKPRSVHAVDLGMARAAVPVFSCERARHN